MLLLIVEDRDGQFFGCDGNIWQTIEVDVTHRDAGCIGNGSFEIDLFAEGAIWMLWGIVQLTSRRFASHSLHKRRSQSIAHDWLHPTRAWFRR
jgi:hypothetical protein